MCNIYNKLITLHSITLHSFYQSRSRTEYHASSCLASAVMTAELQLRSHSVKNFFFPKEYHIVKRFSGFARLSFSYEQHQNKQVYAALVEWLMLSFADLSQLMVRFHPGKVQVRSVVEKWHQNRFLCQVFPLSLLSYLSTDTPFQQSVTPATFLSWCSPTLKSTLVEKCPGFVTMLYLKIQFASHRTLKARHIICITQETHALSATKPRHLVMQREITAVCFENYTRHIDNYVGRKQRTLMLNLVAHIAAIGI